MQSFMSLLEVAAAQLPAGVEKVVTQMMQNMLDCHGEHYDPANDGLVVLIDDETTDDDGMRLFGHTWAEAPLEGVKYCRDSGTFLAVILLNNQLAHHVIVPDMPWLRPEFRDHLVENLVGKERP